ncbi:MAG: hypothetical protein ACD_44C00127G0001, partial [uncultured bacterium]
PKTKILIFSDKINFNLALQIFNRFQEQTQLVFGIGTNLTNDLGHQSMQNVIKMTECNGQPVAKITDEVEKAFCHDLSYLTYLKSVFKV